MARTTKNRDSTFRLIGVILLALVFCVLSPAFARFYAELLWFDSLDFTAVFIKRITASVGLATAAAVVCGVFLLANWALVPHWIAPKARLTGRNPFATSRSGRPSQVEVSSRPLRIVFAVMALIAGIILGVTFGQLWRTYLLSTHGIAFGLSDPIFGRDVGFYVFRLPWYQELVARAQALIALALVGVLARYALFGQLQTRGVTAHLSLLGAVWLLTMGLDRLLGRFGLLQSRGGLIFGASYTDIHARLPLFTVEIALFFAAAVVLIANLFTRQWKLLVAIGFFWLGLVLIGPLYPAIVQQFTVEPNESFYEQPYIEHNITYTRYAYGLDGVEERDYAASGEIDANDLEANADVLRNVRLWDYRPLRRTYGQLQEIRLYYTFDNVDVDRYVVDGALTQVMLSARELDVDELAEQAQTWVNRHLVFTHGYGLAMNAASGVTVDGLPDLLIRDIPPVSQDPTLSISQPAIYFGERTHEYVVINTSEEEFDFPQGDANVYTTYGGPDGVRLGSALRRLLLATRFGSTQLLLSSALSSDSRILFHRTIRDRAQTIAPMLTYDEDPYPVIVDGRLMWLLDAYTSTEHFPYAQPTNGVNYIRNSVKVTVDAYTGEIQFYLIDPGDPVAATYARIFPDIFRPREAMPEALRSHWRYPETLFRIQSELYATYHMRDPQVFYNREDLWDIPQELVETSQQVMEPYYVTMRLPDSDELEFMLIRPFVPSQKQNMVAWLYARCDGDNYGELGVFKLSKDRLVYGPLQVEGRIDQDPLIAQQLSLWNQRGSHVLRGNLLVIPISGAFLYVEPLYLESESGQLPELTRIIVAYADGVTMTPTLEASLAQIFGTASGVALQPGATSTFDELAQHAWQHYQAAQACLSTGDWACYGAEQAALEATLRSLVGEEADQ